MIAVIDNYDSFTYNLVQMIGAMGQDVQVFRNDAIDVATLEKKKPSHLILSPGPGRPDSAGICLEVVQKLGDRIPILGICLGHQTIGQAYGATVCHAPSLVHGKESAIYHNGQGVFEGVVNPLAAARYHSLIIDRVPEDFVLSAWTSDELIMGIQHRHKPIVGLQFHPESILSPLGEKLVVRFLSYRVA